LGALTVDDVAINGKVVTMTGSACDTIVMTAATNGAFSLVTTDTAAAAANITITADGTVDINSAGLLTLDSGAAINIEPAACSAILLDGTISIDAGVVTGATSITSTAFVGTIDGVLGGNTPAAITGTTLSVDNFTLNGTELDLSSGDFALDVAGDVEINADGGCINFKDASLALAAIVNTSCVGELRIHEAANYIGLKPPALSANQTWTWPATKGSCGEVLTCDGCGVLSFAAAGGGPCQANQAAIEAETNQDTYVPPDLLKHSPGVAKAWANVDQHGALNLGYNISSITDVGTGHRVFNFSTSFSNVAYAGTEGVMSARDGDEHSDFSCLATGSTRILFVNFQTLADTPHANVFHGDQ